MYAYMLSVVEVGSNNVKTASGDRCSVTSRAQ